MSVTIVAIEDGEFFMGTDTSGSTVNVTLRRAGLLGTEYVTCEGILIWDEDIACEEVFDEWVGYAEAGEEGYTYELIAD